MKILPRLLKPDIWADVKDENPVFADDLTRSDVNYLNRMMLLNIKLKGADYILAKVNNFIQAGGIQGCSP